MLNRFWNGFWGLMSLLFHLAICCVLIGPCVYIGVNEIKGKPPADWAVTQETRYDNIERVMMNNVCSYTVFSRRGTELIPLELNATGGEAVHVYEDVPADKPMWARIAVEENRNHNGYFGGFKYRSRPEIHIRKPQDIQGGDNVKRTGGKFPVITKEKVQVVE